MERVVPNALNDAVRGQRSSALGTTRSTARYILALGLFLLAVSAKASPRPCREHCSVVIWWKRGRLSWRSDILPLIPWFALGAAVGLFTAHIERASIGAGGPAVCDWRGGALPDRRPGGLVLSGQARLAVSADLHVSALAGERRRPGAVLVSAGRDRRTGRALADPEALPGSLWPWACSSSAAFSRCSDFSMSTPSSSPSSPIIFSTSPACPFSQRRQPDLDLAHPDE